MTKFEAGKKKINDFKAKAARSGKRLARMANTIALGVVGGNAIAVAYPSIIARDLSAWTVVLTFSAMVIILTALVYFWKFLSEDN